MLLSEILKLAMDSFRSSKVRFALTALGMVIGTASVILVVTIGMTGKQYILTDSEDSAPTRWRWSTPAAAPPAERVLYNDYLTREDEKAVTRSCPA
jgi:putative ABC transport system permease protein